MKAKLILLSILCLGLIQTGEAQILKKIKNKAERAAERTILKRTDKVVTDKTDKTIDGVAGGNAKNSDSIKIVSNKNTGRSTSINNPVISDQSNSQLRDQYEFNWELKSLLTSGKDQSIELNYLINDKTSEYIGFEMSNEELKGQGKMYMVMDNKEKKNIMFMEMNGQKMGQIHKMPDFKEDKSSSNMKFKEIGTKEILGYTCYGIEVEDQSYTGQLYYTIDAPVSFSALFAMANNKNTPKGFDPALLQVLKEDALLMEMTMTHKSKRNENFSMRALSLDQKKMSLSIKDYQFMNMGF